MHSRTVTAITLTRIPSWATLEQIFRVESRCSYHREIRLMGSLRIVGLIVVVFLVSLPATFFMHSGSSGWLLSSEANESEEGKEDHDNPIVDILCLKAMKEMSDGNFAKAIAIYSEAIEREPKYSFSYIGRGDAYALRGDIDRAIQDYNQAARLDPSNTTARERLALAKLEKAAK